MYVSLPKNYSGTAFSRENTPYTDDRPAVPPTLPQVPPPRHEKRPPQNEDCEEKPREHEKEHPKKPCDECGADSKNPISCLLRALRGGRNCKDGGLDTEDFLLIGLIALLIGKEGNEDIIFILAMLLLI
ncbi:MAG: hypothetical protein IJ002_07020 [Clostridia bacterium]|nr:hypothetical protein [Clostridia bacterium]